MGASEATAMRAGRTGTRLAAVLLAMILVGAATLFWLLQEGSALIESAPPGAEVWLDGQRIGTTPLTLRTRLVSTHGLLEFRLAGYETQRANLALEPRQTARIGVTLASAPGKIEVRSEPPGAKVFIDDAEVGVTPLVVEAAAVGPHKVRLLLADHADWSQEVTVKPAGAAVIVGTLSGLPGALEVVSTPAGGTVFVDGRERGVTPLALPDLALGEHEVRVAKEGYVDWLQRLTIGPNARVRAEAALSPQPRQVQPLHYARPIAAMIDNHPFARPEAGLAQADIVYEALAEGGITRFMGLFFTRPAEAIGPIRSARHYFIYWAAEYDAMYAHCGGYPEAYAALRETGVVDLDDLQGSPGFWRSNNRAAPHNLYTSTEALRAEADRRGIKHDEGATAGLLLSEDPKIEGEAATRITLFYPYKYVVAWEYDPAQGDYLRFTAGAAHVDQTTGEQLRGTNVVVLYMRNWFMAWDDAQDFQVTGSGRALYFTGGKVVEGKWSRAAIDQPTYYWDAAGERVTLREGGTTWIQVVPIDAEVVFE